MMYRRLQLFIVATLALSFAAEAECWGALASELTGRKRFTARLASNKALRRQQLIIDPEGVIGGSASVQYNTDLVRLVDVLAPGEFDVTGGFVGVLPPIGGLGTMLVSLDNFFASSTLAREPVPVDPPIDPNAPEKESGYVQVFFERRTADVRLRDAQLANSVIPNLSGFTTVDEDGQTGIVDTHALIFEYLPNVDPLERAAYTVFATPPRNQTVSDSIVTAETPDSPIQFDEISPATVLGPVQTDGPVVPAVPLPAAVVPGFICLAGLGLTLAWRRRVQDKPHS